MNGIFNCRATTRRYVFPFTWENEKKGANETTRASRLFYTELFPCSLHAEVLAVKMDTEFQTTEEHMEISRVGEFVIGKR